MSDYKPSFHMTEKNDILDCGDATIKSCVRRGSPQSTQADDERSCSRERNFRWRLRFWCIHLSFLPYKPHNQRHKDYSSI